ncbi:MAG TPA: tRNA-specific 2-thiouridylase, partial [Candidatus Nanoarchaeia archaeon]|nr:tRNA-specific 2-thiouridylase [Candidatus Nanoarchaeia archaeon]
MIVKKTVLLGLSGGVDSAVSALLLKKQGFNVIGLFMQTFREESRSKNPCKSKSSMTDEKMAKIIAKMLKIKFIPKDYKKEYYKKVIMPMIKDYQKGLTPNPDIVCNKLIKFPYLLEEAKRLGADYIATGHYARIKKTKFGFQLLQGKDIAKDQSYFLYDLDQKTLSKTLFPIGNLKKEEVRKIAERHNFPNWDKPGTAGIC